MPTVYLVVPCYNEEEVLPETVRRLTEQLLSMREQGLADENSRMLLVDDGSRDQTWALIEGFSRERTLIIGDSPTSDIAGGQGFGLDTCWFNPSGRPVPSPAPKWEIRSLRELTNLLL